IRGALDAQGKMTALDYAARSADYNHLGYNEPDTVLIAQLFGQRRDNPAAGSSAFPNDMYEIPNRRTLLEVVGLPLIWETPLRTGNLRDPNGPQSTFAAEAFIDEMAFAAKADPVEFRMRMLTAARDDDNGFKRARSIAVLKAAAGKFGWQPRPAALRRRRGIDEADDRRGGQRDLRRDWRPSAARSVQKGTGARRAERSEGVIYRSIDSPVGGLLLARDEAGLRMIRFNGPA